MTKSSCLQSFNEGERQRMACPLHQGRYKLEECLRSFISCQCTLGMVRSFVNEKTRCINLGRCMASDKHIWLKDLPLDIAFALGYKLLPGLLALKKEGAHEVDRDYPAIEHDCLVLVERFEEVRRAIEKDISVEYRHMMNGSSLLEPLVDDAISLVQKALAFGGCSSRTIGLF